MCNPRFKTCSPNIRGSLAFWTASPRLALKKKKSIRRWAINGGIGCVTEFYCYSKTSLFPKYQGRRCLGAGGLQKWLSCLRPKHPRFSLWHQHKLSSAQVGGGGGQSCSLFIKRRCVLYLGVSGLGPKVNFLIVWGLHWTCILRTLATLAERRQIDNVDSS